MTGTPAQPVQTSEPDTEESAAEMLADAVATPEPPALAGDTVTHRRIRLWTPIVTHSVTDFLSFVTVALMPLLAVRLDMSIDQKALLLSLGAFASGGVQPLVAWINDRLDSRLTGALGLATAAVCVGSLGYAQTFPQLLILFFFGILGVGAFHPATAAATGQLAGTRRSAMLSVYFLFGMIGGILGNVLSPQYVNAMGHLSGAGGTAATDTGLRSLVWFIPPGLIAAGVLAWSIRRIPHRHHAAHDDHHALPRAEQTRRWIAFWILYAGNVIRFTTNQMLVYLMIEWTERLVRTDAGVAALNEQLGQKASELNGPLQGSMQVGMGFGALALGFFLPARHEKKAFILIPLIGAGAMLAIPTAVPLAQGLGWSGTFAAASVAGVLTIVAGFGFGSLVPVSMSLGQRLLPHRTSFASGMMLGGAWCVAVVGPQIMRIIHEGVDSNLETGFAVAAGGIALASVLACWLPGRLIREIAPH
jgi:MFS family permease